MTGYAKRVGTQGSHSASKLLDMLFASMRCIIHHPSAIPLPAQAVNNCFLYRMPLARLALVLRCLPAVRANLLMYFAATTDER